MSPCAGRRGIAVELRRKDVDLDDGVSRPPGRGQPSARGISETCVGAGPGAISPGNSGIFAGAGAGTGSGGGSGSGSASAPGEPTTAQMAAAVANAAKRRRTRLMANSNCVDG